jgi:hypothetical protein
MSVDDLNVLLTRKATAVALTERGYPVAAGTLATKAVRGGGPPYRRFGTRVLYRWGDAVEWARANLGPVVSSTSELNTHPRNAGPGRSTTAADTSPAAG